MVKNIFLIVFSLLIFTIAHAQTHPTIPQHVKDIFDERGELYFKFEMADMSQLAVLSSIISIDGVTGNDVYAYANRAEFEVFLQHPYDYTVLTPPSSLFPAFMRDDINVKGISTWDFYPTYGGFESMMYQFGADYPSLCQIYNLGTLNSGRKILAAKITSNINQPGFKPRFNYSSSMHGDELVGYVLLLRFIDYLLSNYGTDPRVTYLVNNIEIWITPLENPDGAYTNDNSTVNGATRNNANNIDLNRNYKNPAGGNHPDGNAWQQETIITMAYLDTMNFTLSANMHGGIECVNYPWDSWTSSNRTHADHAWWQLVSHEYADTARFFSPSAYMNPSGSSFFNGVTHGGDWYVVRGSRQDYLTYYTNSREFTLELSNTKLPPASQLPNFWDYNYRSFLNYMQQSLYGLKGIVTDSCTGAPIKAKIEFVGHDTDNSHIYSFLPLGNYHRPALAGNYTVSISAPGYQTKTFNNILINNYNATSLNVALAPLAPSGDVSVDVIFSCNGQISFEANIHNAVSWEWNFGDGHTSTLVSTIHIYALNGVYYPGIMLNNCTGSHFEALDSIVIDRPQAPVADDVYLCNNFAATLIATGNNSGVLQWYINANDNVPVDTGSVFVTPVLNQTTTFYVDETVDFYQNVGETNAATNGAMFTASVPHYLEFDCYKPVRLVSAMFNAGADGMRTITLNDAGGQAITSVTVFIPQGISRVELNIDIPVGNNLRLVGPPSPNLFRSNAGLSYPYEIQGYISIHGSSATTNPTGYYYYFYDWDVLVDECVSIRKPVTANINSLPIADFSYLVNVLEVTFENNSSSTDAYLWDFGDGNYSTQQNPIHQFADYGIYDVSLIVTNDCGSDTLTQTLVLTTLPPVVDFTSNSTSVNEGGFVQFTDLSQNNPNAWQWYFEGGTPSTSTLKNPQVQYMAQGVYYVALKASNPYGVDSIIKIDYVTVFEAGEPPLVDFTANQQYVYVGDTVIFTDLSLFVPHTWLWNFEGGTPASSNLQHPSIVYNTPGTYMVALIATNDYGTAYEIKYAYIQVEPLTVFENSYYNSVNIYPNPVDDILNVTINMEESIVQIEIINVLGNSIVVYPVMLSNSNIFQINVSELSAGFYYVAILTKNVRMYYPIIKN